MEKKENNQVLERIERIYERARGCKLTESFFASIDDDLQLLSDYFRTSKREAFFVALAVPFHFTSCFTSLGELIAYCKCNPAKVLIYSDDLCHLFALRFFEISSKNAGIRIIRTNVMLQLNEKLLTAIVHNQPVPETLKDPLPGTMELLEYVHSQMSSDDAEEMSLEEMYTFLKMILSDYPHLKLVKILEMYDLPGADLCIYLYLLWETISGKPSIRLDSALHYLYNESGRKVVYKNSLLAGESSLQKNNLVEVGASRFVNAIDLKLTDYSLQILKDCGISFFLENVKREDVILPEEIPFRELLFSKSHMEQLLLLKDLLRDEKLAEVQRRLSEKNLPKGVAALLYGAPGTGKTEIVLQMAKASNRKVMKVEICQARSKWYGDSEKQIKRIFSDYKSFTQQCEHVPILLFNECDAIFSKRGMVGQSALDNTENAIQSVLLDELENFEGILLATTNLVHHLDAAFERRFLFKISFPKPDPAIRVNIWKLKFPGLPAEQCKQLAEQFDFSGGQIDNVLRKIEINEIIHGQSVTLDKVMAFCADETIVSKKSKMGFTKY